MVWYGYYRDSCLIIAGSVTHNLLYSGDVLFGGTNSGVMVTITGSDGTCTSNILDGHGDDFQGGDNDCYDGSQGLGKHILLKNKAFFPNCI